MNDQKQKQEYQIEVEICSETIFTAGEVEGNLVRTRALTDENGFVYFHAKTLKGQLRRQALWVLRQYENIDSYNGTKAAESFKNSIDYLFGKEGGNNAGALKLGNLELPLMVREYFIIMQQQDLKKEYYRISAHDLIEGQTQIRTGIQIDESGTAKDKMLTTYHTVKDGLIFYSDISFENTDENFEKYLEDFIKIIYSFRRIGAGIHRGRGEIKARLLLSGKEINLEKYKGGR